MGNLARARLQRIRDRVHKMSGGEKKSRGYPPIVHHYKDDDTYENAKTQEPIIDIDKYVEDHRLTVIVGLASRNPIPRPELETA